MITKLELKSQQYLNEALKNCSEKDAAELLKAELKGGRRRSYVMRIYSRFNRMRAARERKELLKKC